MQKMPLLRELKLNNSALSSVRNLGSKLQHLQVTGYVQYPHVSLLRILLQQSAILT